MKKKGLIGLMSTLSLAGVIAVASVGIGLTNHKNSGDNSSNENQSYTITFETNGGNEITPEQVDIGGYLTEPAATRPDCEFLGWYTDKALTKPFDFNVTPITSNITLYAKWGVKYTVTFDTCGGELMTAQQVTEGSRVTEIPTWGNYEFQGWYLDENYETSNSEYKITGDTTLYAKWSVNVNEYYDFTQTDESYTISSYKHKDDEDITELYLPCSYHGIPVTGLGNSLFSGCTSLTSITIPSSINSIGHGVFYKCSSLGSITIPSRATKLTSGLFYRCSNLTSIIIPAHVEFVDPTAFNGCTNLSKIYLESNSIPSSWRSDWKGDCSASVLLYGTDWFYDNGKPVEIHK